MHDSTVSLTIIPFIRDGKPCVAVRCTAAGWGDPNIKEGYIAIDEDGIEMTIEANDRVSFIVEARGADAIECGFAEWFTDLPKEN